MVGHTPQRAKDYDEIKPLVELCKAGRLFEVQEWIADGKPINPPPHTKGLRKKCPLQTAIDKGFHSLAKVLLDAGAIIKDGPFNALELSLFNRRLDLIKLLVDHGADLKEMDLDFVFDTWDPEIIDYFIDQGADVESGNPLATALCSKFRTALGVFKRYKDKFPSFQDQLNIALRHHCKDGNLKWVSLLLWAGADPFAKGPDSPWEDPDPEEDMCALEYAALYQNFEIFKLKKINISPDHPIAAELLRDACRGENTKFLLDLLKKGFNPANQEDHGSSLIQTCINHLQTTSNLDWFSGGRHDRDIDTSSSRETIKIIHILAKHGAMWRPADPYGINDARRSLLKMKNEYTVELVWIMAAYNSCSRETIEQLLRTPSIRRHVAEYQPRIDTLLKEFTNSLEESDKQ